MVGASASSGQISAATDRHTAARRWARSSTVVTKIVPLTPEAVKARTRSVEEKPSGGSFGNFATSASLDWSSTAPLASRTT